MFLDRSYPIEPGRFSIRGFGLGQGIYSPVSYPGDCGCPSIRFFCFFERPSATFARARRRCRNFQKLICAVEWKKPRYSLPLESPGATHGVVQISHSPTKRVRRECAAATRLAPDGNTLPHLGEVCPRTQFLPTRQGQEVRLGKSGCHLRSGFGSHREEIYRFQEGSRPRID